MTATLPTALAYGTVTWTAVQPVADTTDPDTLPDPVPVTGTVTFTPSAPVLLAAGDPPVTVIAAPLTYTLADDGTLRDPADNPGITLVATDSPGVTPTGWTWTAAYRLNNGLTRGSFSFALPAGETVDLTTVAPVATSGGTPVIQGPAGPAGPQGPAGDTSGLLVNVRDHGAAGDATTDDTAALQAALAACPEGGIVYFPPGTYLISAPLTLRRNRTLSGSHAGVWPYDTGGPARIRVTSGFTGPALILMQDEEALYGTVGAPANGLYVGPNDQSGMTIRSLTLDGFNVAGPVDGILASGLVRSIRLSEVSIRRCTGSGVHTVAYTRIGGATVYPRGWRLQHVTADSCGNMGFATNLLNDTTFLDCLAVGNTTHGFYLAGPGETLLVGCRAAWNKARGYYLTGTSYGNVVLSGCTTDRNDQSGVHIDCTGRHPVLLSGCALRRDGRNGGSGGGSYAALTVSGAVPPVAVPGITTETGQDDDATGAMSPQYGLRVLNSTSVTVGAGVLWGMTAALSDGGGNTNLRVGADVVRGTGSGTAPTFTYL